MHAHVQHHTRSGLLHRPSVLLLHTRAYFYVEACHSTRREALPSVGAVRRDAPVQEERQPRNDGSKQTCSKRGCGGGVAVGSGWWRERWRSSKEEDRRRQRHRKGEKERKRKRERERESARAMGEMERLRANHVLKQRRNTTIKTTTETVGGGGACPWKKIYKKIGDVKTSRDQSRSEQKKNEKTGERGWGRC